MIKPKSCPRDAGDLDSKLVGVGLRFYVCPTCSGMWVSKADLESYVESQMASLKLPFADDVTQFVAKPDDAARCLCGAGFMNTVNRQGVRIDVCPECQGLWLDGGEVQKLFDSHKKRKDLSRAGLLAGFLAGLIGILGDE